MIHCTKCNITWAKLGQYDDDNGDETYEFCPVCKTDMHLKVCDAETGFIMCPLNGEIINVVTREPLVIQPSRNNSPEEKSNPFDFLAWKSKKEAEQKEQDERLSYYHQLYEESGREAAEQYYFNH